MITEAHNYTLIDTWIYGMGNECNTGMKGQYTLATHIGLYFDRHAHTCKTTHAHSHRRGKRHVFLSGCKVNVKCMVGNDDVKVQSCELDGGAPYGSLRPCHYLVTPLIFIRGGGGRERGADHSTTEIVWGQQCHNYFKMSACNKIQQFIWQKAN